MTMIAKFVDAVDRGLSTFTLQHKNGGVYHFISTLIDGAKFFYVVHSYSDDDSFYLSPENKYETWPQLFITETSICLMIILSSVIAESKMLIMKPIVSIGSMIMSKISIIIIRPLLSKVILIQPKQHRRIFLM